ncbi:MAG: hypothetical protein QMB33_00360, partial [Opitutales bacterium]
TITRLEIDLYLVVKHALFSSDLLRIATSFNQALPNAADPQAGTESSSSFAHAMRSLRLDNKWALRAASAAKHPSFRDPLALRRKRPVV